MTIHDALQEIHNIYLIHSKKGELPYRVDIQEEVLYVLNRVADVSYLAGWDKQKDNLDDEFRGITS